MEEISTEDDKELSLISCHPLSASTRYIDTGASSHIIDVRDLFSKFIETSLDLEVVLGNDTIFKEFGRGIAIF